MDTRRQFIKAFLAICSGLSLGLSLVINPFKNALAAVKRRILPKDTDPQDLINEIPSELDTRNLKLMPLSDFDTMGLSDHTVDLNSWRLKVLGDVRQPLQLTYSQLLELPALERNVLLICPGFFTIHGRWQGVSISTLLRQAGAADGATHVTLRGPDGSYEKVERFAIADILSDKVFLAYRVNGEVLPKKHGFPLRLVAEDHYGSRWVKYVHQVEVHKLDSN